MSDEVTYHDGEPAINVKQNESYNSLPERTRELIEALPPLISEQVYQGLQEDFWSHYAQDVAGSYGYGEAFSAGRSSGWLTVQHPPILDPETAEEHGLTVEQVEGNQADWAAFTSDILDEIDHLRENVYPERLKEALAEHKATEAREAATFELSDETIRWAVSQMIVLDDVVPRAALERLLNTYGPPIDAEEAARHNPTGGQS